VELKKYGRNILLFLIVSIVYALVGNPSESRTTLRNYNAMTILPSPRDTVKIDTTVVLPYKFKDEPAFAYPNKKDSAKLFLKKPANIKTTIEYDPVTGEYDFVEKGWGYGHQASQNNDQK